MNPGLCQPTDRTVPINNQAHKCESRECTLCGSPRHKDNECPLKKLEEIRVQERNRSERGNLGRRETESDGTDESSSGRGENDDSGSDYEIGVLDLEVREDEEMIEEEQNDQERERWIWI